jgi:hypothetical protein
VFADGARRANEYAPVEAAVVLARSRHGPAGLVALCKVTMTWDGRGGSTRPPRLVSWPNVIAPGTAPSVTAAGRAAVLNEESWPNVVPFTLVATKRQW